MLMIKFIGWLGITLLSTTMFSQATVKVDSLLKLLDANSNDTNTISILKQIGSYYADNNPNKALGYYEQAAVLSLKEKNNWQMGEINYQMGKIYMDKNDFKNALKYYQASSVNFESVHHKAGVTNADIAIGTIYFWNKDYNTASGYFSKAEADAQIRKDSLQISSLYSQRGRIYAEQGNYDSALIYFKNAASISKIIKDPVYLNKLSNIGITYKLKKQTPLALQYFDKVLAGYQASSNARLVDFASVYNNIASAQAQANNYHKAMDAFNKSIDYATRGAIPYIVMENYQNMAQMFGAQENYRQQTIYLQKYYNLKDSIFSNDNKNQLTQLEADYQIAKKNASLVKEQAAVAKSNNERNVLIVIAAATFILLTLLFFLYYKIKRSSHKIKQQNNELENLNQVKDRLFSVISHDLRNPMVALNTYLSLADNPATSAEKKLRYKNQTQQAINQTSSLLDNLLAWANMQVRKTEPAISFVNLNECIDDALNTVQAQAEQKEITFVKNMDVASASADVHIIEIALRNLISNAIKFSPTSSKIEISTYVMDNRPCIEVRDEGMGMTPTQLNNLLQNHADSHEGTKGEKGSGLGIFLVKALLDQINATLHIESIEGAGSKFIIKL